MTGALAMSVALSLAQTCAPQVAPLTLLAVAKAESGLDPLTIGVNTKPHRALHPATVVAAVATAMALQARGESFDLGLTQINNHNLQRLGLSLESAFDPCRNLAGGAEVLTADYLAARPGAGSAQEALTAALSTYNTGDARRGLRNGYVVSVIQAAARVVPALALPGASAAPDAPPVRLSAAPAPDAPPSPPPLDVFSRPASPSLVWADLPSPATRVASPHHPHPGEPT